MNTLSMKASALYASTIAHPNRGILSIGALYFMGSASSFVWSYIPRYFETLGLSGAMVGWFFTMKTVGQTLATPVWAHWTDRNNTGRGFIQIQHFGAVFAAAALPLISSKLTLVAVALVFGITLRCSGPLIDAMAIDKAGMSVYGQLRAWGAMGFGLVAIAASMAGLQVTHGELARLAPTMILVLIVGSAVVTAALPATDRTPDDGPQSLRESWSLLKRPALVLLLPVSALYFAAQAPYGLFLVGLAEERAFGAWVPGLAVGVGILGEVMAFATANRLMGRTGPAGLLVLAMVVTGIRLFLTGIVTHPGLFVGLQVLHGLSFAVFYMALVSILNGETTAANRNTGQALLYLLVFAVGGGLGTLLSGMAYDLSSAARLFQYAGLVNVVLLPMLVYSLRRSPGHLSPSRP
jgi:MFS transporter, PPP family, 3-phenylpropionic acid transporter